MMESVTVVLGGIVIALASGTIGKLLGEYGTVRDKTCSERRSACSSLVVEKIDHLASKVESLERSINDCNKIVK